MVSCENEFQSIFITSDRDFGLNFALNRHQFSKSILYKGLMFNLKGSCFKEEHSHKE
jgi:hypothetical protein